MADVKFSQKVMFTAIVDVLNGATPEIEVTNEELIEFLEGRITQLEKKASNKKAKENPENDSIKVAILDTLAELGEPSTVSALQKADDTLAGYSNQKVTAMLRKLIDEGKVIKDKDKKSTVFALAGEGTEVEGE